MRKDHFTDKALALAKALTNLKYSENPEDQLAYAEALDFARCQRPDGSFYGTAGQCRMGTPAGAKEVTPSKKKSGGMAGAKTATDERIGRLDDRLMDPNSKADPSKVSAKIDKLEKKSKRMGRVLAGKEAPTAMLKKTRETLLSRLGDLEDKQMSPGTRDPGKFSDEIDRLERKIQKIDGVLKRVKG